MAHTAICTVQAAIAVTQPNATGGQPWDVLKMHNIPSVVVIYPPGSTTNDANFTGPDITRLIAQGALK